MSLSVAIKTDDGRIFAEAIDCRDQRDGNDWMINFLLMCDLQGLFIDGASGVEGFTKQAKDQKLKGLKTATTKDIIAASSEFERIIAAKELVHMGQPSLRQSVCNCLHRAIGSSGGYGYKSLDDAIDVSLIESLTLAVHACASAKEPKQQRVFY